MSNSRETQLKWLSALGTMGGGGGAAVLSTAATDDSGRTESTGSFPQLETRSADSGQPGPGLFSFDDESNYLANWPTNSAGVQEALQDKADAATQKIRDQITAAYNAARDAASKKDYKRANEYADKLPGLVDSYRKTKARAQFEKRLAPIDAELQDIVKGRPPDADLAKIWDNLAKAHATLQTDVIIADYISANKTLDTIAPLLEEFRKAIEAYRKKLGPEQGPAKAQFEKKLRGMAAQLQSALQSNPSDPGSTKIWQELRTIHGRMRMAVRMGDYVAANKQLDGIPPLLDKYHKARNTHKDAEDQAAAKPLFEKKIGPLQAEANKVILGPQLPDATIKKLHAEIVSLDSQIEFAVGQANYVAANNFADELSSVLGQYRTARAKAEKDPKVKYDSLWPNTGPELEGILKSAQTDKFMKDLQGKLKAKKGELDKAVASKNYALAVTRLEEITALLKQFHEEGRKTPRLCEWLNPVLSALSDDVHIKFNNAANKLDSIADAYDNALKAHQETLQRAKEKRSLLQTVLEIVFIVALPGAIGGAAAAGLKQLLGKAEKSLAGGGLVDGTKDTLKFLSRLATSLGLKPEDPPKPAGILGGSGVKLTRSISRALRAEENIVLDRLKKMKLFMADHAEECAKHKELRVEGDPGKAFSKDPFLSVIEGIGAVDQKGFGTEIWRAWMKEFAFELEGDLVQIPIDKDDVKYHVKQSFDDDIISEIKDQVSSGFDVERELEKVKQQYRDHLDENGKVKK